MARNPNTDSNGKPFDEATIEAVWLRSETDIGFPDFRKDVYGAIMLRSRYGLQEQWGWEIDHIKPVTMGGMDELDNLQALQWENNRDKADHFPYSNYSIRT